MELFHASNQVIRQPIIVNRFRELDFGAGFYTTPNKVQADDFASKVYKRRSQKGAPTVNCFSFNLLEAEEALNILRFQEPGYDWLEFVVANRRGTDASAGYDLIIGPVANDDVFSTIILYESGVLDADTAIKGFKIKRLFQQYLFHTEQALEHLSFASSYTLGK